MKHLFILVAALAFFFSCSSTKPVPKEPAAVTPVEKVDLVKVLSIRNFTEAEKTKLNKYIPVMNNTVASKCFKDFMVERNLHTTQNKSNEEVVKHLRTSQVEIHLITYYKPWSKVAGYTYPNTNKIWLNRKFHAGASLCSEASNLAHELSHKLGYTHSYKATQSRPFSVPYSINAAFKACCKN